MFSVFCDESGADADSLSRDAPTLYVWEHEIDYGRGAELAARIAERPADIPVFFGMAEATDDEQKQANEVEITRLLDSVVVHVVFLDNRESGGRGYAEFRSFAEIAAWSRHFNKVLGIRFPNENALRNTENVLLIVARGEQVKVSREELDDFNGCIEELNAFKSCYFLDYNLSVDDSHELFHSRAVWNVMVGRLLLGFLLSQEKTGNGNSSKPVWLRPGVKIWRAAECVAEVSGDFLERRVERALGKASSLLQNWVDSEKDVSAFCTDDPVDGLETGELSPNSAVERDIPSGGWSEFEAEACAKEAADPGRWDGALKAVRQAVTEWKQKQKSAESDGGQEAEKVFQWVHDVPGRVFSLTQGLFGALGKERAAVESCGSDALELRWNAVVKAEQMRCETLRRAQNEARELKRAQNHYVGLGFGLVVVAAVSVLCGWVLHQLIAGLEGSIVYSIWLAASTALGAFGAFGLVLFLHWRAGRNGTLALLETCKVADNQMGERHARSREIVEAAIGTRARLRRMNRRFRAWTLLERVKSVVVTETQSATARVGHDVPAEVEGIVPKTAAQRRQAFEGLTRKAIGPLNPLRCDPANLDDEVERWWGKERAEGENFRALWMQLCKIDRFNAGHFPVRVFIRNIREFVSRFNNRIRGLAVAGVVQSNQYEVRKGLLEWVRNDVMQSSVRQFVSGSIDALHDCEAKQLPALIFVQDKQDELDVGALRAAIGSHAGLHGFELIPSALLESAGQLSFLYQEFVVGFDRNADTGHLTFKEVSDAT
jgi:hypothetical protein